MAELEWWIVIMILLGGVIFLMMQGMPVAFSFLLVNLVVLYVVMGSAGADQLALSIYDSLTKFSLAPIPLFTLMGEILYHSGLALRTLDVVSKLLGSIRARLALVSIISGAIFAALSGSTIANTAMLGSLMLPEMRRRGYSKTMSVGPLMASGGLAMIIPPSALTVLLGSLASISIGKLLIGGIIPGILLAILYATYVIARCWINPSLAPAYQVATVSSSQKLVTVLMDVVPVGGIIFLVTGLIFLGVATPTEAAALGALGAVMLARVYGKLNVEVVKKSVKGTLLVAVMTFMIIAGSGAFSQLMAYTGATRGLVATMISLPLAPLLIFASMQFVVLILGCFIDQISIMMITLPMFMPLVTAFKFDPVWFGIIMLINLELAMLSPPFGMLLFVMKGVAPPDVTMGDIWKSALPFIICDLAAMVLITIFPAIATWLPYLVKA